MSDPQDAEPASGAGSAHRTRPRRRAARPAGPPTPSAATEPATAATTATAATPATAPETATAVEPIAAVATPPARTRTKARHSARTTGRAAPDLDTRADEPAKAAAKTEKPPAKTVAKPPAKAPGRRPRPGFSGRDDGGEAGWRDLVGAGPSKVGLSGALRARDVDRPTAEDMAEAERSVVIVRRDPADPRPTNAAATGDAPTRRARRKRPSGSGV